MKVWSVVYFESDRYGSMREKAKTFPRAMTIWEVRSVMDRWVANQQTKGKPIFPQYDVSEEEIAA